MIRLVCVLKRNAGLSDAAFRQRWRDEHGPRVAAAQAELGLWRYVQTHRDPESEQSDAAARAMRGDMLPPFDGAADYWWPSVEALRAVLESPEKVAILRSLAAAEGNLVDASASALWLAHEYPQVSIQPARPVARLKTGLMKLMFALQPLPSLSAAEAQHYWLTRHGPLVRSHAVARGMTFYQQVHCIDLELAASLRGITGFAGQPFLGHAEAWFERLTPRAGPDSDAARNAAVADEFRFIDMSRSMLFTGKELVFVERDWIY